MKRLTKIFSIIMLVLAIALVSVLFSGCIDVDYTTAEDFLNTQSLFQKMSNKGYNIDSPNESSASGAIYVAVAEKKPDTIAEEYVRIYYFDTEDGAIDYYENELPLVLKRIEDEDVDFFEQIVTKRCLKIVLIGTAGAVEDALA